MIIITNYKLSLIYSLFLNKVKRVIYIIIKGIQIGTIIYSTARI